jgi:hypothetical protein
VSKSGAKFVAKDVFQEFFVHVHGFAPQLIVGNYGIHRCGFPNAVAEGLEEDFARLAFVHEAGRSVIVAFALSETDRFAQSNSLEINGVKENYTFTFDEAGLVLYQSETIPDSLHLQVWVIESDEDVQKFALDVKKVMQSDAFLGLVSTVGAVLAVTNPLLTGAIGVGGVVVSLLHQKRKANCDDLVGYRQVTLNRTEHYPHVTRDRQDVYDSTGNIQPDYTLFGSDKSVDPDS